MTRTPEVIKIIVRQLFVQGQTKNEILSAFSTEYERTIADAEYDHEFSATYDIPLAQ